MKVVEKVKVNLNPLEKSAEEMQIPTATVVHNSNVIEVENVEPRGSSIVTAVPISERKSFQELEGKNLAEIMQNMALKIAIVKGISGEELTDEDRARRENYRSTLASYIKENATTKDLHQDIQYGNEKLSVLELAAKLNLGSEVATAILDKASYSKEILDNTLKIVKDHRRSEKFSNYKEAAGEIVGSVESEAADMLFEAPGAALVGGAIGLVGGVIQVATTKIGETVAKDTKKLIKERLQKYQVPSSDKAAPKVEIEMSTLNSANKRPSKKSEVRSH